MKCDQCRSDQNLILRITTRDDRGQVKTKSLCYRCYIRSEGDIIQEKIIHEPKRERKAYAGHYS